MLVAAGVMAVTGTSASVATVNVSANSDKQQIVPTPAEASLDTVNHEAITVPAGFADLVKSGAPTAVTVDPTTGVVESVVATPPLRFSSVLDWLP